MKTLASISLIAVGIVSLTACDWLSNDRPNSEKAIVTPIDTATTNKPDSLAKDSSQASRGQDTTKATAN